MSWLDRNMFLSLRCPPPFAWRWRPHEPKRFMRTRQAPYEGYRDRMSGNYEMQFNKIDRTSMWGDSFNGSERT